MTPEDLARLHARAFSMPRPWSAAEFADLLASPHVFLVNEGAAFALGRVIAGEAELLTIATDPDHRRKGLARRTMTGFDRAAAGRGAVIAFLEVAATNAPAIALYTACGWQGTGLRKGYYRAPDGTGIDARIMGKSLP